VEQTGALQPSTDDLGLYRRAEIDDFVTWSRTTVVRLRDLAEQAVARAAEAEDRAQAAEARAAEAELGRVDAERALQRRDHDMHAVLGRALLLVQQAADQVEIRANEVIARARAEAEQARLAAEERERVPGLWAAEDEEDSVFTPMRALRASGS
jgi:hypothetical protein